MAFGDIASRLLALRLLASLGKLLASRLLVSGLLFWLARFFWLVGKVGIDWWAMFARI